VQQQGDALRTSASVVRSIWVGSHRYEFSSRETYLNFADLLASEQRNAEAREWGAEGVRQEAHYARLPAPERASLVPAGKGRAETCAGVKSCRETRKGVG
jgi:hypothetical protein